MSNSQKSLSRKKQPIAVEQDSRVLSYTPSKTNIESYLADNPTITPEQFRQILSYAYQLQDAEINAAAHQRVISDLEIKTQEESKREDNQIEISAMFKVAKDLGLLDNKYVQKALELHAPSQQQIKTTLDKLGSRPSLELIEKMVERKFIQVEDYIRAYTNTLENKLNSELPHLKFEIETSKYHDPRTFGVKTVIYQKEEKIVKKEVRPWYFFGKKKKVQFSIITPSIKPIVNINFRFSYNYSDNDMKKHYINIDFGLKDYLFTEHCQDLIDKKSLKQFFPNIIIDTRLEHFY